MQEAIKLNQQRMRKQFENQQKIERMKQEIAKKQQKKEQILTVFIAMFIISITICVMSLSNRLTENAVKSCVSNGYNENYCRVHV